MGVSSIPKASRPDVAVIAWPATPSAIAIMAAEPESAEPATASEDGQDYAALRASLERTVGATCPAWLAADRDDLVQTTLMRLMRLDRAAGGGRSFTPYYLRRTAHSVLVDEIRRRRRRHEVPLEAEDAAPIAARTVDAKVADPERVSAGREVIAAVRACLGRLLEPRRLAVTLYLLQHTVPQTAALLGWEPKRAENLVYRGLADLRGCLRKRGLAP